MSIRTANRARTRAIRSKPPIRALAMVSGLVATLALCPSALAAFPGQNGPIAFMSDQAAADIYTRAADGSGQSRLTTDPNQDHEPAFSPDGQQIVFTSWRHGNPEIYVMNADGSGQTRLTNNADFDQHPSFSPDGQRIVFTSTRGQFGGSGIYVMAADGSGQTPLTSNPGGGDAVPVFSPDGQRIAFARRNLGTSGYFEIFTMAADGGDDFLVKPFALDEFVARVRWLLERAEGRPELESALTGREIQILTLVAEGLGRDEIARRLFISPKTVGTHVERIFKKLGVHTRAQAVSFAYQHGLLPTASEPRMTNGV